MRCALRRRGPVRFAPEPPLCRDTTTTLPTAARGGGMNMERSRCGRALSRSSQRAHAAQPARLPQWCVRLLYVEDTSERDLARTPYCNDSCNCCPQNFEPRMTLEIADCHRHVSLEFDIDTLDGRANSLHKLDTLLAALQVFRRSASSWSSSPTTSGSGSSTHCEQKLSVTTRLRGAQRRSACKPGHRGGPRARPPSRLRSSVRQSTGFRPRAQRFDSSRGPARPTVTDRRRHTRWPGTGSTTSRPFERTSKRRRGFPSETGVKRGHRSVRGGEKELLERLGNNDPCPCGSTRRFQALLPQRRQLSTAPAAPTTSDLIGWNHRHRGRAARHAPATRATAVRLRPVSSTRPPTSIERSSQ